MKQEGQTLCSLRISAFSALRLTFNAEDAENAEKRLILLSGAHRKVTGFGQNVHGFRHLWIV